MKTIYFKNGVETIIGEAEFEIINRRIIEGAKQFQTFSTNENELYLLINISEIVCIK